MAKKKAAKPNSGDANTESLKSACSDATEQDQLIAADVAELADLLRRGVPQKEWLDAHIDRIPLWEQAAGRGTAHGLMLTGLCHWFGVGRDVDHEAARPFFEKAAKKRDPQAQFSLGQLILIKAQEGQGTETAEDAYKLFLASAESGLAQAQFSVAEALWKGDGVEEDEKAAIVWWKAAAEQGHAEAALLLARLHLKGWPSAGIEKDRDAALDWGRRAATAGLDEAATWVSEHENGPDPDESYVISNIADYVSEMRLAAAKSISENTDDEDAQRYLADEQAVGIVRKHSLGFDQLDRPILNQERHELIFEEVSTSIFYAGLAAIADNATVDPAKRAGAAESLAINDDDLYLAGITTLSDVVAQAVARHKGIAWLDGLATLSLEQAKTLARHEGTLSLNGLYTLSDVIAEALSHHVGELFLDNVVTLSSHAAEALSRHKGPVSLKGLQPPADESNIRSTLALRDAIAKAPSVLQPVGTYGVVINEDDLTTRDDFLGNCDESSLCSDVQMAVGEYLASISVPDVWSFVSRPALPPEFDNRRVSFALANCNTEVALDAISGDLLRQLYEAAAPASFGDMKAMETRVDPLVRSGREIASHGFSVSPELCRWVERTWAEHFVPRNVRAEPYKINLYGPGDRFATHRDTPEKDLVGTFLVALGGWGPPCQGGGLVVHDTAGTYRWDGARGWAAFIPYLPHEVEPITSGARATIAFKVFSTNNDGGDESVAFDEALLEEAADRIALCRNENGQVGVLLAFAYSLNGTALCGRDLFIYRALERLGRVESIPVAVHMEAEADSSEVVYWSTQARVYSLTQDNLARVTKGFKQPADNRLLIPFIPTAPGHEVYKDSHASVEWAGNYAEPANVDTLYVQRALIVTPTGEGSRGPVRCAGADFRRCDLSRRNLDDADLSAADLSRALLSRATLCRANLVSATLHKANLSRAKLKQADLTGANLSGANLKKADLTGATLCGTNLENASLKDAVLHDVRCDVATRWPEGFHLAQHNEALATSAASSSRRPSKEAVSAIKRRLGDQQPLPSVLDELISASSDDNSDVAHAADDLLQEYADQAIPLLVERFVQDPLGNFNVGKVLGIFAGKQRLAIVASLGARLSPSPFSLDGAARIAEGRKLSIKAQLEAGENPEQALTDAELAVKLDPDQSFGPWTFLAELKAERGNADLQSAVESFFRAFESPQWSVQRVCFEEAISAAPDFPWPYNAIAWHLASAAEPAERDGAEAVRMATTACALDGYKYSEFLDTLAAAYAENGDYDKAVESIRRAIAACPHDTSGLESLLERYQAGQSYPYPDQQSQAIGSQWPAPEGTIANSIGMKFVPIAAGEFLMGTPGDEGEEFPHQVRITKEFLLGMHQVTQFQYERVTGDNPSLFKGRDRPVEHLSWKDAARFCELLSAMPEEQAVGRQYRLPTEAEWEYACRAGSTTRFNTGETLGKDSARFALKSRTKPKSTKPVGSYPPNAWGLFDMHGNVWEWTNDWFSSEYYRESPADDPKGPPSGTHHTLRGGSASVQAHECASAFRGEAAAVDGPETTTGQRFALYGDLGIRVVCEVQPMGTT
jgi:formylglycine-generating enzyme required for sulfatase activity/TPR repeat protein